MEQELETLKSKYTEVMKLNKILEKQSSEITRESKLEDGLKDLMPLLESRMLALIT